MLIPILDWVILKPELLQFLGITKYDLRRLFYATLAQVFVYHFIHIRITNDSSRAIRCCKICIEKSYPYYVIVI